MRRKMGNIKGEIKKRKNTRKKKNYNFCLFKI